MTTVANKKIRFAFLIPLAAFISLLAFGGLGLRLVEQAQPVRTVDSIVVAPAAEGVILGWQELGQHLGARSAEREHLLVSCKNGDWRLGSMAWTKKVDVRTTQFETLYLKRWPIKTGDQIDIDNIKIEVKTAGSAGMVIEEINTARQVEWTGGILVPDGHETVYKQGRSLAWRIRSRLRWWFRGFSDRKEIQFFTIGGGVNLPDRWKVEGLPPEAARVIWFDGGFWLAPGSADAAVLMTRQGGKPLGFSGLMLPVAGERGRVLRVVLGKTYYRIRSTPKALTLVPVYGSDVFRPSEPIPETNRLNVRTVYRDLEWIGAGAPVLQWLQRVWLWAVGILVFAAVATLAIWIRRGTASRSRRSPSRIMVFRLAALLPAITLIPLSLLIWRTGGIDMKVTLFLAWLAWVWATGVLIFNRRLGGIAGGLWLCSVVMAGIGTLTLTQLAAGADNTRWLRFCQKQLLLMTAFGWAVALLAVVPLERLHELWLKVVIAKGRFLLARVILPAAAVALLGIQLVFGGEQGLWGVQPAELAKLLLVLMAGFVGMHLTELRRRNAKLYQRQPARYILDFLKMLILVAFGLLIVLAGVRDISPILIIGILGLAWLWKVAPHPWKSTPAKWGNRGLVFLAAVVILILAIGAKALPEGLPEWVPQRTRFQVWAYPERYPHSGMQVFQATAMAAQGSWLGASESWFGENGNANTLPAVQNDFIISFLLFRFGGLMGLLLMGVQLVYILLLFRLSRNLDNRMEKTQDWRLRQSATTHGYIIFGLAWIHIAQWSISWGNALGILPVMGQPMTWISAANSHMLFVGLPVLVLAMVSSWVVEDR